MAELCWKCFVNEKHKTSSAFKGDQTSRNVVYVTSVHRTRHVYDNTAVRDSTTSYLLNQLATQLFFYLAAKNANVSTRTATEEATGWTRRNFMICSVHQALFGRPNESQNWRGM